MSEENIKKIEKKVDLLYKILLKLNVDYVGHPYDQEYIGKFMNELIPLFGLSGKKVDIKITQKETMQESESKLKIELSRLEKIYESGNFLAKDKDTIKNKIGTIKGFLQEWDTIVDEWILSPKTDMIKMSEKIYEESLFLDLHEKLRIKGAYNINRFKELIREFDNLKKKLINTIEKIHNLGEVSK